MTFLRLKLRTPTIGVAAALLILGACGDSDTDETPDAAAVTDAAPGIDANTSNLTVRVLVAGNPAADADVIVHDSTGVVISEHKTDATGEFSTEIAGGEMVTAVVLSRGIAMTWEGVQPGDELVFPVPGVRLVDDITVTLPAAFGGADNYLVSVGGCQTAVVDPTQPVVISPFGECVNAAGETTVVAFARDVNNVIVASTFERNVATVAGGTSVTLNAFDATNVSDWTLTLANLDANRSIDDAEFFSLAGGFLFSLTPTAVDPMPVIARDSVFADFSQFSFVLVPDAPGLIENTHFIFGNVAGGDAATSVDIASRLMPDATAVTRDDTNPARPVFNVTRPAAPTGFDGVITLYQGSPPTRTRGGGPPPFTWLVVSNDPAQLSVPAIPASLVEFSGRIETMQSVTIRTDFFADYDEARGPFGGIFFANPLPRDAVANFDAHRVGFNDRGVPAKLPPPNLGAGLLNRVLQR